MNNPIFQAISRLVRSLRPVAALTLLALWVVLAMGWWWQQGIPSKVSGVSARIDCLSYAPFRRPGATPFAVAGAVTPAQIEEDLRLLQHLTPCVRTYGVGNGLEDVPQVARKLGMRVRLGAWLGNDQIANQIELDRALTLTKSHADVIDVLIVGNEVLLRKDLSNEQLRQHLKFAKANTQVPVTYADVWEFWRVNANLQDQVDWVTIHILPYWEDKPVAASDAAAHVLSTARTMQVVFPGKPIWIGETGWPAAGRQRGPARPGAVEQALVLHSIVSMAQHERLSVNFVEAFDQPWKKALEGAMGGAWGVFRADGTQRALMSDLMGGTATEDPHWQRGWASALAGGLLAVSIGWVYQGRARLRHRSAQLSLAKGVLGGALITTMLPLQWDYMALWSRNATEFSIAMLANFAVSTGAVLLLLALVGWQGKFIDQFQRQPRLTTLFIATCWALILLFDARYRGFPLALFLAPACFSMCGLFQSWVEFKSDGTRQPEHFALSSSQDQLRFLAFVLLIASVAILFNEGIENLQAVGLCFFWVTLAACSWPRPQSRRTLATLANPASSNEGAANSAL